MVEKRENQQTKNQKSLGSSGQTKTRTRFLAVANRYFPEIKK